MGSCQESSPETGCFRSASFSSLVCGTLNKVCKHASSGFCVDTSLHFSRSAVLGLVLLARLVLTETPTPLCRAAAHLTSQRPVRGPLSLRPHQRLVASRIGSILSSVVSVRVSLNSYDLAHLLTCSSAVCPRRRSACSCLLPIFELDCLLFLAVSSCVF